MLKVIHTGDIHIGAKFKSFGKNAKKQRQALIDSFKRAVDYAILKKADLFLISGDLFDSNFPSYDSINLVKDELKKLNDSRIYVAILPGTHDCLSEDSIYLREDFSQGLDYVFVFDKKGVYLKEYPKLDLTLYGYPLTENKSSKDPLLFLQEIKRPKTKYHIAMAHGSVAIEGKHAGDDWPIDLSLAKESGMDYIALGHWHSASDFSLGAVKIWYCGSPEITYQEGKGGMGQGYILEVDLLDSVSVNPVKISKKAIKEMNFDLTQIQSDADLVFGLEELKNELSKDDILVLNLVGVLNPEIVVFEEKIREVLEDSVFSLKINDKHALKFSLLSERDFPENLILGQYIKIMKNKIENEQDEEKKNILIEALQLGVAELEGKEVIFDE